MKKLLLNAILIALLFASCRGGPNRLVLGPPVGPDEAGVLRPFTIIDYKNRERGESLPEWLDLWLNASIQDVEALPSFEGHYVFVGRNEGVHLAPLHMWLEGFSPELDFPRLAAARIERRFASEATHPDDEYGPFYEALIKTASDALWTGAMSLNDFWIRRRYTPNEEDRQELETWEFLILLTIDKELFASQLDNVINMVNPHPTPTIAQTEAANRILNDFFNGF